MKITISYDAPSDASSWNELARLNGNYIQSTHYDAVQSFYDVQPIYLEMYDADKLVAGLKLSHTFAKSFRFLTASISGLLHQFSEFIVHPEFTALDDIAIGKLFEAEMDKLIQKHQINHLVIGGFFGPITRLINYEKATPTTDSPFNIASVNIQKSDEDILKSFNRNTRRNIKTAVDEQLSFRKAKDDLSDFFEVMDVIYNKQQSGVKVPNFNYIKHAYKAMEKVGLVDVYMVYKDEEPLSTMYFYKMGNKAYSVFGGAVRNTFGAGQFGYYELMKLHRDQGIHEFIFGQTGSSEKYLNDKFNIGITNFKLGFSPTEQASFTHHYIFSPFKEKLWQTFIKLNAMRGK